MKEHEKNQQIKKAKEEMHPPNKMNVIHRDVNELYTLIQNKYDSISHEQAREE